MVAALARCVREVDSAQDNSWPAAPVAQCVANPKVGNSPVENLRVGDDQGPQPGSLGAASSGSRS